MAIGGALIRLAQASYYAVTEKDGLASDKCIKALEKGERALKRLPLFETGDIISELINGDS